MRHVENISNKNTKGSALVLNLRPEQSLGRKITKCRFILMCLEYNALNVIRLDQRGGEEGVQCGQ